MQLYKALFYSLLLLMLSSAYATPIYKWIDEDGQVHYGSKAKSKNAKEVPIKNTYIDSGNQAPALSAQERADKQKKFVNALEAEEKSLDDAKQKKEEQEALKIQRCNASKDQLRRRESASALYDLDEKGNRILLNKKQYEIAMTQARARVEKWCN